MAQGGYVNSVEGTANHRLLSLLQSPLPCLKWITAAQPLSSLVLPSIFIGLLLSLHYLNASQAWMYSSSPHPCMVGQYCYLCCSYRHRGACRGCVVEQPPCLAVQEFSCYNVVGHNDRTNIVYICRYQEPERWGEQWGISTGEEFLWGTERQDPVAEREWCTYNFWVLSRVIQNAQTHVFMYPTTGTSYFVPLPLQIYQCSGLS